MYLIKAEFTDKSLLDTIIHGQFGPFKERKEAEECIKTIAMNPNCYKCLIYEIDEINKIERVFEQIMSNMRRSIEHKAILMGKLREGLQEHGIDPHKPFIMQFIKRDQVWKVSQDDRTSFQ